MLQYFLRYLVFDKAKKAVLRISKRQYRKNREKYREEYSLCHKSDGKGNCALNRGRLLKPSC